MVLDGGQGRPAATQHMFGYRTPSVVDCAVPGLLGKLLDTSRTTEKNSTQLQGPRGEQVQCPSSGINQELDRDLTLRLPVALSPSGDKLKCNLICFCIMVFFIPRLIKTFVKITISTAIFV